jgi:ribosomal protein L22
MTPDETPDAPLEEPAEEPTEGAPAPEAGRSSEESAAAPEPEESRPVPAADATSADDADEPEPEADDSDDEPEPETDTPSAEEELEPEAEAEAEEAPAEKPKPRRRRTRKAAEPEAEKPSPPKPDAPARRRRSRRAPGEPAPVVRAQAKYVRSSARKARLVCDHIRGKSVEDARAILALTPRAIAQDWSKLLESAVANAEHNHELVGEDLYVKAVHADEGPTIKRFRPRAMGRATKILKRTSHLTILLTPKD